jgi:hypothetical protein
MQICGLPQPLTGSELVTILQEQGGQLVMCSLQLSALLDYVTANTSSTAWAKNIPATEPASPGVVWDNDGVVSIS